MYARHHNAKLIPSDLESVDYEFGNNKIPAVNVSASHDEAGKIHVTLCNLNPNAPAEVNCDLKGAKVAKMTGQVLTAAEMNARNTFEKPENLKLAEFNSFRTTGTGFATTLPAKSVVMLELE
jgi:alpha-N-arabinofuranosidase